MAQMIDGELTVNCQLRFCQRLAEQSDAEVKTKMRGDKGQDQGEE